MEEKHASEEVGTVNYEHLYNDLLKDYNKLKAENDELKTELLSIKKPEVDYKKINENLRKQLSVLQKNSRSSNLLLLNLKRKMSQEIEKINKNLFTENETKLSVSPVLSSNQLDLILKKKKQVHWTKDEMTNKLTGTLKLMNC